MLLSPEQLSDLRKQVLAGQELPRETYRAIVDTIRANRGQATAQSKAKSASPSGVSKAKQAAMPIGDLFKQFGI